MLTNLTKVFSPIVKGVSQDVNGLTEILLNLVAIHWGTKFRKSLFDSREGSNLILRPSFHVYM